ncbi:MAG: helix-turn-helix domain-containing protein [Solirubrobacteraceae bacterium]
MGASDTEAPFEVPGVRHLTSPPRAPLGRCIFMKPFQDITDPSVAKALAHPLRTRLLAALDGRTASPSQLAAELDVPLGVLSYHVRRLVALGFLRLVKRVPRRGAVEHYYTATARPRATDQAWGATPSIVKQAVLGASLDQVGTLVTAAAAAGGFDAPESRLSRIRVSVDAQGWREMAKELAESEKRIEAIERASQRRLETRDGDGSLTATVVGILFQGPTSSGSDSGSGSDPGLDPASGSGSDPGSDPASGSGPDSGSDPAA